MNNTVDNYNVNRNDYNDRIANDVYNDDGTSTFVIKPTIRMTVAMAV